MLEFKRLDFQNYDTAKKFFARDNERRLKCGDDILCDQLFGTTFLWRNYYNARFAVTNDSAVILASGGGTDMFSFPLGGDIKSALKEIKEYAHERGIAIYFCFISEKDLHFFYDTFDIVFPSEEPDWFDYVYDKDSVTNFNGRIYHRQKNHYNKFIKTYPDCHFKQIDVNSIELIKEYVIKWHNKYSDNSAMSIAEEKAIVELLDNWNLYGMTGGYIVNNGEILGVTMGETCGETIYIHFEKAEHHLPGAYQFLSSEYLKCHNDPKLKYVNREEDMGISGLRKSKSSLHPVKMLKKFTLYCC